MSNIRLSRELTASGYSDDEIWRLVKSGELQHVRRGAYVSGDSAAASPEELHRRLVEATVRQGSDEVVVSHLSAAVLHGLPVWPDQLSRVHLTRNRATGAKLRRYVHLHAGALADDEVTEVAGLRVTTGARTAVDLGRSLSFVRSVPIGDATLAAGVSRDELTHAVERAARRKGVGPARRMLDFCDGRSESVGESTSRVVLHQCGVPAPRLQLEVFDDGGELVGRSDFGWEEYRTLGEFDGKVKYGRLLKPGQTAGDVVFAEKLREDRLRDLGWQVVRWTWSDLARPRDLSYRLNRALARGSR
jgi:hypothetical protein